MFSNKRYKSQGVDFHVEVLSCVIFRHTLDCKFDEQAIKLVSHMTGDYTIKSDNLLLAMHFCSELLKKTPAKFLANATKPFNDLHKAIRETHGKRKARANAIKAFREAVKHQTVHIHKPMGTIKEDWAKCKADAAGFRLGSQGPGLYG